MSKKSLGIILVICGIFAFYLIGSEPETLAKWSTQIDEKIYSDPIEVANRYVFLGGNKGRHYYFLYEIDQNGQQTAKSVKLPVFTYQPLACGNIAVVADKSNMIRGFRVPGLSIAWEAALEQQIMIAPVKISNEKFVVASGKNALYCIDSKSGQPIWDYQFQKSLVNFAADKVIVSIYGYTDLKNPMWNISGHDLETGEMLWTAADKVSSDNPLFIQELLITTTPKGQLIVIDQNNDQTLFKHATTGTKAIQVVGDRVIMLAAGGSRIICFSLMTGDSWTTTLNSGFTGATRVGNRLLFATKKTLRCVNADNGSLFWSRELNDVYNAFPFRDGIFITHKDSFFERSTYGSYISAESSISVWTAYGRSIFRKPLITAAGDLILSYNGTVKMMPPPAKKKTTMPSINFMPDPEAKVRKAFNSGASKAVEEHKSALIKDKKNLLPNLEIKDSDWTNEKP